MADFDLKPFVSGRIKSITGIYRKMYMQGRSFDEIYDVYAVRVIVDTVNDCYNVLGIIHDMFRPIPNRFKDYISTPKSNMYQSLHTTVISKEKIPFEVQIRTWEMHYTAEYGIAAHWKYKLGIQKKDKLEAVSYTHLAPSVRLWPGMARTSPFGPYLPMRGPRIFAPTRAATPPTI